MSYFDRPPNQRWSRRQGRWGCRRWRHEQRQWLRRALLDEHLAQNGEPRFVEGMGGSREPAHRTVARWVAGRVRKRCPVGVATLRKALRDAVGAATWGALGMAHVFAKAVGRAVEHGAIEEAGTLWSPRLARCLVPTFPDLA